MKATIVSDEKGGLVALHLGPPVSPGAQATATGGQVKAGLMAGPGQKVQEVELPDQATQALTKAKRADEILAELRKHVPANVLGLGG